VSHMRRFLQMLKKCTSSITTIRRGSDGEGDEEPNPLAASSASAGDIQS
jgi:hypothetical protein